MSAMPSKLQVSSQREVKRRRKEKGEANTRVSLIQSSMTDNSLQQILLHIKRRKKKFLSNSSVCLPERIDDFQNIVRESLFPLHESQS